MLYSLALAIFLGFLAHALLDRVRMPALMGMLAAGIFFGPFVMNLLAPSFLGLFPDIRLLALVAILLRAGLGLQMDALAQVGGPALRMSILPTLAEVGAVTLAAPWLLGFPPLEAALLGSILAAVSPAVVVPRMIDFLEKGRGLDKGLPVLILAASSLDNVFAIMLFGVLQGLVLGQGGSLAWTLTGIPLSLLLGLAAGILPALGLVQLLKKTSRPFFSPTLLAAGLALALVGLELALGRKVPQASLLSLMALGFILMHQREGAARTMAVHMKKAWGPVEILLFVLLGAQVDPAVALKAGLAGLGVIAAGLAARSLGVGLALWGTGFTFKEKKLAMISFVPKATVQAALGPLPLALGLAGGEVMLAVAVLSILVTAPLGALGIGWWGDRVLSRSPGHVRPFRRHRDSQGLPRVGWRIRERSTGLVWKVIEEREEWRVPEGESTLTPAIVLRIWREQDQPGPNRGPTRYLEFTPSGPGFDWHWEVVEAV